MFLSDDNASRAYDRRASHATYTIEVLAKETARPYVFSSQFHMLALSSVIGLPIFSVYPDIPGISRIKNSFHGICIPREHFLEDGSIVAADPIHIMWTRATRSPLRGWTPNHFAPLIPSRKLSETASFAEVVKRGRKRLKQFSFEKQLSKGSPAKQAQHDKTTSETQQPPSIPKAQRRQSKPEAQQPPSIAKSQQPPSITKSQQPPSITKSQQPPSITKSQQPPSITKSQQPLSIPEAQQKPSMPKSKQRPSMPEAQQQETTSEAQQRLTKPKSQQQQISCSKENFSMLRRPVLVRKKHKVKKNRSEVNLTDIKLSSANDNPKKVSFFKPKAKTGDQMMPKNTHTPPEKKSNDEEVPVELFPLSGPGIEWYREKGINAISNISKSDVQLDHSFYDGRNLTYVSLGSV